MSTTARLRLLQTTDLHMHLLGYDYVTDAPTDRIGLANLIPLIEQARAEAENHLLLDNGDFLQGNPMADLVASGTMEVGAHPIAEAFARLGYDAVTLGNHEFDYGLPFLQKTLAEIKAPSVCANARTSATQYVTDPWVILDRVVTCADGSTQNLRIGLIGFVTPQVMDWNAHVLSGALQTDDVLSAARSHLPALRRAGADIVVALCHTGISDAPLTDRMENVALHLAGLPGIDVVLTGHTHDHFPSADFAGLAGIDIQRATLNGTPALMPGAYGDCLGQLDLDLELDDGVWRIAGHQAVLRWLPGNQPQTHLQAEMTKALTPLQDATLTHLRQPVCESPRTLNSYFAYLGQDETAPLLANAMMNWAQAELVGTEFANLPILASTSPYRTGGHGGPRNYTAISAGPLRLSEIAAIVPFNNPMLLVLRWGWQIRAWLESASRIFNTLTPGQANQPLINPHMASYHFDSLHGLRYRFDLSVPPRLGNDLSTPMRVRDITCNGKPLRDDDRFFVATTSYRAHGGGGYAPVANHDIIASSDSGLADLLVAHLKAHGIADNVPPPFWSFAPMPETTAWFATSPAALLQDNMTLTGQDADGFARITLAL